MFFKVSTIFDFWKPRINTNQHARFFVLFRVDSWLQIKAKTQENLKNGVINDLLNTVCLISEKSAYRQSKIENPDKF